MTKSPLVENTYKVTLQRMSTVKCPSHLKSHLSTTVLRYADPTVRSFVSTNPVFLFDCFFDIILAMIYTCSRPEM